MANASHSFRPVRCSLVMLDLQVDVYNECSAAISAALLEGAVRSAVEREGQSGRLTLALYLLDDAELRAVNREQRGIDRATDVLSFPLIQPPAGDEDGFVLPPGERQQLGDILISYQRAVSQAAEYGHSVEREVCYLAVHGVLHILGHDHEDEEERRLMRGREETALGQLGLTRE